MIIMMINTVSLHHLSYSILMVTPVGIVSRTKNQGGGIMLHQGGSGDSNDDQFESPAGYARYNRRRTRQSLSGDRRQPM